MSRNTVIVPTASSESIKNDRLSLRTVICIISSLNAFKTCLSGAVLNILMQVCYICIYGVSKEMRLVMKLVISYGTEKSGNQPVNGSHCCLALEPGV
jgi:hypothetical protein